MIELKMADIITCLIVSAVLVGALLGRTLYYFYMAIRANRRTENSD